MPNIILKDPLRESRLFGNRAVISAAIVIGLLLFLTFRLTRLQITEHDHFRTLSRENRVKLLPLPPTRGLIYDRNGLILAQNLPAYSLEITPEQVENVDETIASLSTLLPISDDDIKRFNQLRERRRRFEGIPIRVRLSEEQVARFSVNQHRFPGVEIQAKLLREYPLGADTAHVVGYVGRINREELGRIDVSDYSGTSHIGKNGVEKAYEDVLHGTVGLQQVEVNAGGRVLRVLESQPPVPGRDLHLFLDTRLQEEAEQALADSKGAVVAIEIKTGGVLALVSKPGFDPNLFVEGISSSAYEALRTSPDKPLFNRALRGQYPPGSTIKPFIGLAGLEQAAISGFHTKFCPGFFRLPGHRHKYRDWKKTGHGTMDLHDAIVQSCDVFFYDLARTLGVNRLHAYLSQFGFGTRTGIDLVGELPGLLPSRDWKQRARNQAWYPGETLIMGIGQGYFLTTPLQLAYATAILAARGERTRPRIVDTIITDSHTVESGQSAPNQDPLTIHDAGNWDRILEAMTDVVESPRGTARRIRSDAYRIAGKTGTAQVFTVKQDEKYNEAEISEELRDHALFLAFAPVDDPRIAVAVVVENGGHGGSVAAPIARRVMDRYLLDNAL